MRAALGVAALVGSALALGGCYAPHPSDGSFSCSVDFGNACPPGYTCKSSLCVKPGTSDMSTAGLDLAVSGDLSPGPRTCDQRLQAGGFANLVGLSALNTSSDESHLAFDGKGKRLVFARGNQLYGASLAGGLRSPAAPVALTITGGPTTLTGGSFTTDGTYWFTGTTGGVTSLYKGSPTSTTGFTAVAQARPTTSDCAFSDPSFETGDATAGFFASYALAGCNGQSYVVRGANGRESGTFYSALADASYISPSLSPSALTLFAASVKGAPRLYVSGRSGLDYQFGSTGNLPMGNIGQGIEDRQLIVSDDCSTVYLVSVRSGGTGLADLYAADVAAE